jgi:hypothetical protein
MDDEVDDFGPLKSRTTTPGKTPEQHTIDQKIKVAARVRATGMLPRCSGESQDFVNEAYGRSVGVNRRFRRSSPWHRIDSN